MSIATILGSVFKTVPIIVSGIEALMGRDKGKDKLETALEILVPLLSGGKEATDELVQGIILIINGTVKVKHALGEFTHNNTEG